jgi:hypothetical protein
MLEVLYTNHPRGLSVTATKLQGSVDSSTKTIATLQWSLDAGVEYYEQLVEANKSPFAERDALPDRSVDLESELVEARASITKDVAALEMRIKSTRAHALDVAAGGEKRLADFEKELIKDLADMCVLYEHNVQSVRGLRSLMPEDEPLVTNQTKFAG